MPPERDTDPPVHLYIMLVVWGTAMTLEWIKGKPGMSSLRVAGVAAFLVCLFAVILRHRASRRG